MHPVRRTPVNAIITFVVAASAITGIWALGHLIGGHTNSLDALNFFFESSTMGTILLLVVYFLANLALPFFYRRYRPQEFNVIKHGGHLSGVPFEPSKITHGFTGLAAAFPLGIYLFIGWENSAALAEETNNPRRNVPRAVFISVALMAFTYLLVAYSTVSGFGYNENALTSAAIPFISVSHDVATWLTFIAYLAGLTSTLGVLIAAVNSQCRLIFNAGREGLLPRWIGYVHPIRRTPVNAIITFVGFASAVTLVWALGHWIGGHSGSLSALNFFFESSTMGTILILVVYFLANLALPFYYRKYRPAEFNIIKHIVLPVLGMVAIAVPVYYLVKPGQPQPYDWFPYAALGVLIVSIVYSMWLVRRDPGLGDRVGSIVADE